MWLADTSVKRPVFATMLVLVLVVLGAVSYPNIGVDLFPKVDLPIVNIRTTLKGASSEIMDIDVTDKIEEAVNTINGIKTIASVSTEGASVITIEFVLERDIDLAVQDVREKISIIRSKLPTDIDEPIVEKVDPDATPVLWFALYGDKSPRDLSTYANEVLKEQFQRINGVGALRLYGLRLRQARIWLDNDRLRSYGITAQDVSAALARGNVELPGGAIEGDTKEYTVKVKGEFPTIQDFNNLIVGYSKGAAVKIKDVGRAEDGMEEKRTIARFNGINSVNLGIQKQSGTNTVEVVNRVKQELKTIRKTLPAGMNLAIAFDQSDFIKRSINDVQHHLIYGGLFAIFAVLIFLRNVRTTLISAMAIPTSVISTFAIMNAFGFTFNNMSMLALSLSIGILIDDAIIVIENIHRHIEEGMTPREASFFATSEIGLAVSATTLAIIVIFIPVAFMKGIIGRFFFQFGLTVVFAVMVSWFVSFTLTPMMSSLLLKRHNDAGDSNAGGNNPGSLYGRLVRHHYINKISDTLERGYRRLEGQYRTILVFALSHRKMVLTIAVVTFVLSLSLTKFIGKEFVPSEDQSRFVVRLQTPVDYSIEEVDRMCRRVEEIIRKVPEVTTILYSQGGGATRELNKANLMINLKPKSQRKKRQEQIKAEIRKSLRGVPGLRASVEDVSMIGGGQRQTAIQYSIRGLDLQNLETYTREVVKQFSKLPGIVDLDTSLETGKPEVRVLIDRDKAADLGVDIATVAETVNFLIGGEVDVTKFKDEAKGRRYDVRARLIPGDRANPDDIGKVYVRAKDGRFVQLANITNFQEGGGSSIINRVDRQRAITLFANLEKTPLGHAKDELDRISANVLPSGYSGRYKGQADMMAEAFGYLMFAMMLGIIMAYMVLAAQFESFIHPFTVLLSMPFSFIGAFGALLVFGKTLNIFSFIGLILLMGLVKKNAILLVDYTNVLRERGMSRRDALLQAGPVRLRPILMTTFAMILGMMPIAIGIGEGAETRSPMALATIGGLLTSLLLTLVAVPVAYDLFDELQGRLFRRTVKGSGPGVRAEKG
ncbi:MAG: Multidrug resistance protein MdtC [Syntrophorhabdus sp. PtaU1.Bin058]|nr:MAG: Multidrug resistance protein MdtC [Syntrophorhabdus sp. PtaU1.Bin058]